MPDDLKRAIVAGHSFKVTFRCGDVEDWLVGQGHSDLQLSHSRDLVFRRSTFLCPRTVLVRCTKAAADLDRRLVERLKDPGATLSAIFEVVG